MMQWIGSRLGQVRRDARMVASGFGGARASVFVVPPKRQRSLPGRPVAVVEVRRETEDVTTLVLADRDGAELPFEAGQFFTVVLPLGSEVVRRAYSVSSDPGDRSRAAITIRRIPGGRVSGVLANVPVGTVLHVIGPSGSFAVPPGDDEVCFVAGGVGITPILSMLRGLVASGARRKVSLVYGNRSSDSIAFGREVDAWVAAGALRVHHVVESPDDGHACAKGVLDASRIQDALAALDVDVSRARFLVSGPVGAVASVERALEGQGVPRERILVERFASAETRASAVLPERATATFVTDAGRRAVEVNRGESLLDAGRRQGVDLPFSCTLGGCGACKLRLVAGDVAVDEPSCLLPDERAEGYVLGCVGRPLGDCVLEVPR